MAVEKVEEYRQKDGRDILKVSLTPQKRTPDGAYFYMDASDRYLLDKYSWHADTQRNNLYVQRSVQSDNITTNKYYHQDLFYEKFGYYAECIDHFNGCGFDNCDINLYAVSYQYNLRNKPKQGYIILCKSSIRFRAQCTYNGEFILRPALRTEVEACKEQYNLEKFLYSDYNYSFLHDRRLDLDLLELERTGQISAEEATYRHVLKYADNAWYYYRYGLEEYFRDNHIPVPSYTLDELGYMIHPVTGQKLCPLKK